MKPFLTLILILIIITTTVFLTLIITENKARLNLNNIDNLTEIKNVAKFVANLRPYEVDVWDCSEYSKTLRDLLKNLGYDAKRIGGLSITGETCLYDKDCDEYQECINEICWGPHAWTRVKLNNTEINIESTNGKIISFEKYKEEYIED